jgi:hypothetical protein
MKEVTRIMTIQFTTIGKLEDESQIIPKKEHAERIKEVMHDTFHIDDVLVTKVQDFIRDCDEAGTDSQ